MLVKSMEGYYIYCNEQGVNRILNYFYTIDEEEAMLEIKTINDVVCVQGTPEGIKSGMSVYAF